MKYDKAIILQLKLNKILIDRNTYINLVGYISCYRRANQSILKEINPEYSWEGPMPKLPYFDHLMQRADSLEKILFWVRLKTKGERGSRR